MTEIKAVKRMMESVGLDDAEILGITFLAGMCAAASESHEEFISKVQVFSFPKKVSDLEKNFGAVHDVQIQKDLENFLAIVCDKHAYRSIQVHDKAYQIYEPKLNGRVRKTQYQQNLWDCQLLYCQLGTEISQHLHAVKDDLERVFDNGLFYHFLTHKPDVQGGSNVISTILGHSPPTIKGIFSLQTFRPEQQAKLTNLHVCLFGFTLGFDRKVQETLWAALSFVLYVHGGELQVHVVQAAPDDFYAYCVDGVRRFTVAQPAGVQILLNGLSFSDKDNSQILDGTEYMQSYLSREWPGSDELELDRPEQFQLIQKTLIFFECVKAMIF